MTAYFISGLGADKRIFARLRLPQKVSVVHLEWIAPAKQEPLTEYAKRFAALIDVKEDFVLIGLSFGCIVAVELNKFIKPRQTIIISSIASGNELPWYYKLAGLLKLNELVPSSLLKRSSWLAYWFFGAHTSEERKLLAQILKDTAPDLLKWAIGQILNWKNVERPDHLYHIHGTADKVLPLRFTKPHAVVQGGGHLMVWGKAVIVSELIAKRL